jgi:hypothetical protein
MLENDEQIIHWKLFFAQAPESLIQRNPIPASG